MCRSFSIHFGQQQQQQQQLLIEWIETNIFVSSVRS